MALASHLHFAVLQHPFPVALVPDGHLDPTVALASLPACSQAAPNRLLSGTSRRLPHWLSLFGSQKKVPNPGQVRSLLNNL